MGKRIILDLGIAGSQHLPESVRKMLMEKEAELEKRSDGDTKTEEKQKETV